MAYITQTWTDRNVERPLTFTQTTNADGSITLTPSEGNIIDVGSPLTADRMNHMESGIANALPMDTGGTVTGDLTVTGKILGAEGTGTAGGFSFSADGALDTGMFSPADGEVHLYSNNKDMVKVLDGNGVDINDVVRVNNGGNTLRFDPSKTTDMIYTTGTNLGQTLGNGQYMQLVTGVGGVIWAGYWTRLVILDDSTKSPGMRIERVDGAQSGTLIVGGVTYNSDVSIKKNIEEYKDSALDIINKTKLKRFHYVHQEDTEEKHFGVILQEVPDEVADHENGGVKAYQMATLSWKGIQELQEKLERMDRQIISLQKQLLEAKS